MQADKKSVKLISQNKIAYHNYFIEQTFQAGIELFGTEVKSLRAGKCNLKESFVRADKGEIFIYNLHISPYEHGNIFNKDPLRVRKLLMHKREINKLIGMSAQQGYSMVPLSLYFKDSCVKVELALVKGKKLYDKREDAAEKDARRDMARAVKDKNNMGS